MLALKEFNFNTNPPPPQGRSLLDLPDELLDHIVHYIYIDGGRYLRDLFPTSLVCRRMRKAAATILFETLHLRLTTNYVDRRTFNILVNLDHSPYLAQNVHHLQQDDSYCFREDNCEHLNLSNELVKAVALQSLRLLHNLKRLSVGCGRSALLLLIQEAFPHTIFNVRIEGCDCPPYSDDTTYASAMARFPASFKQHQFALSMPAQRAHSFLHAYAIERPDDVVALSWTQPGYETLPRDFELGLVKIFRNLQELHLKTRIESDATSVAILDVLLNLHDLRRLSLTGSGFCSPGLKIVSKLKKLESLRLNTGSERIFHTHLRNHEFDGLPYLRLPNLRSLELRYISRYLSIEHIIPVSLRHLRIEYHNRSDRLGAFDLRWIAKKLPDLECLELNIGSLANLWHPTAIAGVDVDVEVYRMLEAISSFKKLRILRLFPSYWKATAGYLTFKQPVDDEQAVRIFNHVHRQCSSVQVLTISSSSLDYRSRMDIYARDLNEPMKWVVRSYGTRTILLTHQAKKNYHLEQVWEGERRLTMKNVRRYGRRLHFDEFEDWTLPMYEFPFDEPVQCHST